MLDPLFENSYVILSLPSYLTTWRNLITEQARKRNFEIYEIQNNVNIDEVTHPTNIKGAFIYNDSSFETGLFISSLTRFLSKVFVITDIDLEISTNPFLTIYNTKYKKISETIETYFQDLEEKNININIEEMDNGFKFNTYSDIKINPYPGLFISVDYPDKSVGNKLALNIEKFFKDEGIDMHYTNEPTREMLGGFARSALNGTIELYPDSIQLLYSIDRIEHSRIIQPILREGKSVVSARYALTTLAYSYNELPLGFLIATNSRIYWPDINFVLLRNSERPKELEKDNAQFIERQKQINEGLKKVSRIFNKITYNLDGEKDIDNLTKQALRIIKLHPKYRKLISAKKD